MSADFELAKGRVLHFNEDSWDALQDSLARRGYELMAQHVAEQRKKDVVVLDLAEAPYADEASEDFSLWLRILGKYDPAIEREREKFANWLADQIVEQQTQPPRIPEPGLWGVVEAKIGGGSDVRRFLHSDDTLWHTVDEARLTAISWDRLTDPILIRDGIEGQS